MLDCEVTTPYCHLGKVQTPHKSTMSLTSYGKDVVYPAPLVNENKTKKRPLGAGATSAQVLKRKRSINQQSFNVQLFQACETGNGAQVEAMLEHQVNTKKHEKIPAKQLVQAMINAGNLGHIQVVSSFFTNTRIRSSISRVFQRADRNQQTEVVQTLKVLNKSLKSSLLSKYLQTRFEEACEYGNEGCVKELLLADGVNPAAKKSNGLANACCFGHAKVVDILLKDPRVDPSMDCNLAWRMAASAGKFTVMELLLRDGRCDPSAGLNVAFRQSVEFDNLQLAEKLFRNYRNVREGLFDPQPLEYTDWGECLTFANKLQRDSTYLWILWATQRKRDGLPLDIIREIMSFAAF